jgi:hypothetical protein
LLHSRAAPSPARRAPAAPCPAAPHPPPRSLHHSRTAPAPSGPRHRLAAPPHLHGEREAIERGCSSALAPCHSCRSSRRAAPAPALPRRYYSTRGTTRSVWGTDIPRVHWKDKRPHERPGGPIIRKVIPSWAWGRTTSEADRHKAGSVRAQMAQQRRASNHSRDPTFPRWSPVQRNQARMSRQNYRKIDSISSLSLRCALLSYPHVLPHGRIYKA